MSMNINGFGAGSNYFFLFISDYLVFVAGQAGNEP